MHGGDESDDDRGPSDTIVDGGSAETIVVPDDPRAAIETIVVPDDPQAPVATIVVHDDARASRPAVPSRDATFISGGRVTPRVSRRVAIVAAVLGGGLLLLIVVLAVGGRPSDDVACEGDPPVAAVLARLDEGAPVPSRDELRARIGSLPPAAVIVQRLSHPAGRSVALEVSLSSWPEWSRAAGEASGDDVCGLVGDAIAARGARAEAFFAERPPDTTAEPIGPLDAAHPAILDWLEPLDVRVRCTFEPRRRGDGTLVIACDVGNTRRDSARVFIGPVLYRGGTPDRVYREPVVIRPGERITREYELRAGAEDVGVGCDCEVTTAR